MIMEEKLHPASDWDGNVFKEGDVLQMYSIVNQLGNKLEKGPDGELLLTTPKFSWRRFYENEVRLIEGVLQVEIPAPPGDFGKVLVPVIMMMEMQEDPFIIFCIKGMSDNEEEFFKHMFRTGIAFNVDFTDGKR